MTGPEKLFAILVTAIFLLSAVDAGGQQPSNVAQAIRPVTSVAPTLAVQRTPAEMPPNPPKVTCSGNQLTISAQNSTLGAVLSAIRACIGADINIPEAAKAERLFAQSGPGPVRAILSEFLSSTDFNYVIEASPLDPEKVQTVELNARPGDSPAEAAAEVVSNDNLSPNRRAWREARHNYVQSFTAAEDESSQGTDVASSAPASAETAAAPASSIPVEAVPTDGASAAVAPAASADVSAASAVAPAASADASAVSAVAPPEANAIIPSSTEPGLAQNQGKTTQEMISDMQRMFEQRKQMLQQQTGTVH